MGMAGLAVASGVNGISNLAGASSQADALKAQGEYQKMNADFNAQLSDIQATDAIERGDKAAVEIKNAAQQVVGSQRAAFAANGVEVDSGSAAEIQDDTGRMAVQDAITERNNAAREAWGYKVQSANIRTQGNQALAASKFQAGSTLLTGGLNAAANFASGIGYSKMKPGKVA